MLPQTSTRVHPRRLGLLHSKLPCITSKRHSNEQATALAGNSSRRQSLYQSRNCRVTCFYGWRRRGWPRRYSPSCGRPRGNGGCGSRPRRCGSRVCWPRGNRSRVRWPRGNRRWVTWALRYGGGRRRSSIACGVVSAERAAAGPAAREEAAVARVACVRLACVSTGCTGQTRPNG